MEFHSPPGFWRTEQSAPGDKEDPTEGGGADAMFSSSPPVALSTVPRTTSVTQVSQPGCCGQYSCFSCFVALLSQVRDQRGGGDLWKSAGHS